MSVASACDVLTAKLPALSSFVCRHLAGLFWAFWCLCVGCTKHITHIILKINMYIRTRQWSCMRNAHATEKSTEEIRIWIIIIHKQLHAHSSEKNDRIHLRETPDNAPSDNLWDPFAIFHHSFPFGRKQAKCKTYFMIHRSFGGDDTILSHDRNDKQENEAKEKMDVCVYIGERLMVSVAFGENVSMIYNTHKELATTSFVPRVMSGKFVQKIRKYILLMINFDASRDQSFFICSRSLSRCTEGT